MAWQMDAKRAFRVEKAIKTAVLGDLDTETFVLNAPDDLLDWIDSTIVGAAFEGSASPRLRPRSWNAALYASHRAAREESEGRGGRGGGSGGEDEQTQEREPDHPRASCSPSCVEDSGRCDGGAMLTQPRHSQLQGGVRATRTLRSHARPADTHAPVRCAVRKRAVRIALRVRRVQSATGIA
jgi:hypothetical protein